MRARVTILALLVAASAGCSGPTVDLAKELQVLGASTAWADAGVVEGQNKIVPTISFSLKNASNQTLHVLQVNVLFRRVTELQKEWGSEFVSVAGSEGFAPGATSKGYTVKSPQGYKSTDPTADMLKNPYFIDAKIEIFAKYGAGQWGKIAEFPVPRKLIVQ